MSKKLQVSIYTIIDLILVSLFFILILPFLVDVSSIIFVNKPLNLFVFAKIFPFLFNYINSNINLWINGTFLIICIFYLIFCTYFNIHFIKIIFNYDKWIIKYTTYLIIETLVSAGLLLMMFCSFLKMLHHLKSLQIPLYLIIMTCVPILDVFTTPYWIAMIFIKMGTFISLALYLIWFVVATGLLITLLWIGVAGLLKAKNRWGYENLNDNQPEFINETDELVKCQLCQSGVLEVKSEADTMIVKCNNQPECQYFMPLAEFIFKFFQENGIRIYQWMQSCWKCEKSTNIYGYFPSYQLKQVLRDFNFHFGGPGLFPTFDEYLKNNYQTITDYFSKKLNKTFVVNVCSYCHTSQGRYLTIESPFEILSDLKDNTLDEKYLDKVIDFNTCPLTENEVANCLAGLKENLLES